MDYSNDDLDLQVFGLSFLVAGAIEYFAEHLPVDAVGIPSGNTGLHEFYLALLDFYRRTGLPAIEPIAFCSWLDTETEICAALGGAVVARSFVDHVSRLELSTPEAVTKVLIDKCNTRKQLNAIEELKLVVGRKEVKTEEDVQRLSRLTDEIRVLSNSIQYNPYEALETAVDISTRSDGIWDLPGFLPTPFASLNEAMGYDPQTGGACKGAVHAVVGKSGMGKSTFCKVLMNHWVDNGKTVLFANYEEAKDHWERILFTQITGQNPFKSRTLPKAERDKYTQVYRDKLEEWGSRFLVRHDPDTPYFDDLERWLYDLVGYSGAAPDAVVIDTIQSMFVKGSGSKPRWGQFEEIMVRLEKLAKDLNTAVFITSQENSNRMKEKRDVVQQSDIGGSLTIVQKSSVVIFLVQKKEADNDDVMSDLVMELQIPKNRITGTSFMQRPPLVIYDDTTKSFLPFEIDISGEPELKYENWNKI